VKTLLPASDVPDNYTNAFEMVLDASGRSGAGVGLTTIRQILSSSGLTAADQAKILNLVLPGGQETSSEGLGRNEFNVLLALIGLAQEGEETTFDAVDERRNSKSNPMLLYACAIRFANELRTTSAENIVSRRPSTF
jgi:sorting nexin-8